MSKLLVKWCMYLAHNWNAKSQDRTETAGFRECFAGKAFPQDTRETFCFSKLSFLIHSILTHTIYNPVTHICWGVLLRENPSHKPWELELLYPLSTQLLVDFPQLQPLHFHTIERLIAQKLTTLFQSVKWGFGAAGKHWKKSGFGGCNRAFCEIRRARHVLEGLLLTHVSQLIV